MGRNVGTMVGGNVIGASVGRSDGLVVGTLVMIEIGDNMGTFINGIGAEGADGIVLLLLVSGGVGLDGLLLRLVQFPAPQYPPTAAITPTITIVTNMEDQNHRLRFGLVVVAVTGSSMVGVQFSSGRGGGGGNDTTVDEALVLLWISE